MGYKDKDKQREYMRQWVAARRATWFKDKSCSCCGSLNRLELDHIDPKTKVSHSIWSWSEKRRDEELAKCQVLCHDCHKKKTMASEFKIRGEQVPQSKLNAEQVLEIRGLRTQGLTQKSIAALYGVSPDTIRYVTKYGWKHLTSGE